MIKYIIIYHNFPKKKYMAEEIFNIMSKNLDDMNSDQKNKWLFLM